MEKRDDGGPAFPQQLAPIQNCGQVDGMSLRDYFAGMALQALKFEPYSHETMAMEAYRLADAMLAARKA